MTSASQQSAEESVPIVTPPIASGSLSVAEIGRVLLAGSNKLREVHPVCRADGTGANLIDSRCMTQIVFRHLPSVSAVERQLELHARDRLLDDDVEELPHLIDDASADLFGITRRDTFYWALPEPVRERYGRSEWESNFDLLGHYTRDPNEHWRAFDLDLRCEKGGRLHCFELFGRQLVCALHGLHPHAVPAFADRKAARAA